MKRKYFFFLGILSLVLIACIVYFFPKIIESYRTLNKTCIKEPGKEYVSEKERCCNGLKSVFGYELPDGRCQCTGKDNNCIKTSICAPCGNGKCEKKYKEDKCNCPEDCK